MKVILPDIQDRQQVLQSLHTIGAVDKQNIKVPRNHVLLVLIRDLVFRQGVVQVIQALQLVRQETIQGQVVQPGVIQARPEAHLRVLREAILLLVVLLQGVILLLAVVHLVVIQVLAEVAVHLLPEVRVLTLREEDREVRADLYLPEAEVAEVPVVAVVVVRPEVVAADNDNS